MTIDPAQVDFSQMSTGDDVGRVFHWNDGIYRGINRDKVDHVKQLFDSGLMAELINEKLFPQTTITGRTMGDYPMVLSHAEIKSVTYAFEWSFEMMRAAALTILRVNEIALKYGYQTKDCHSFNVLFEGTHPYYVDIGSFVRVEPGTKHLIWYREFLLQYRFMFYIARTNEYHWVKQLSTSNRLISFESFFLYKYRWLRSLSPRNVARTVKVWKLFGLGNTVSDDDLRTHRFGSVVVLVRKLLPMRNPTIASLKKEVLKARKMSYKTMWGDYQSTFEQTDPRFNRLLEIIKGRNIKTVFEVAGNQGFFANMLLTKGGVERVFCSDYDENAIDEMFLRYPDRKDLSPVLMNLLFQNQTSFTKPAPARFKSDMVVALAIVHHIVLTQAQSLDFFLSSLAMYTKKFVLVEFMPMGLWDSVTDTAPPTPAWYNIEWFRAHFTKYFKVINEETVAKNRVAFFGELI